MHNDPVLPGVIGIDVKFYEENLSFFDWHLDLKSFPIDKFGNPAKRASFARCIQLARGDGRTYIFDLFALQRFPAKLIQLLSDPAMLQIGFNWSNDKRALENTHQILCRLPEIDGDSHSILEKLRLYKSAVKTLTGPTSHLLNGSIKLTEMESKIFNQKRHKPTWMGQALNCPMNEMANTDILHMAADALGHLNLFLALELKYNTLVHFQRKLPSRQQKSFKLTKCNIWDKVVPR